MSCLCAHTRTIACCGFILDRAKFLAHFMNNKTETPIIYTKTNISVTFSNILCRNL